MEDNHFLIDSAPPTELTYSLLCFNKNSELTNMQLIDLLKVNWDYTAQKNFSNTSRRLYDLGLIGKNQGNKFFITKLGLKIREIYEFDNDIYFDIMHYLHNSLFYSQYNPRKLFWSYRKCSDLFWNNKRIISNKEVSNFVLNEISQNWPDIYKLKTGGNFNEGGVSSWRTWVNALSPSPIGKNGELIPRNITRIELILLAIDDYYRKYQFRYGDPILVSDVGVTEISSIFFANFEDTFRLINVAAKISPILVKRDTYSGMAIALKEPYSIERI